MTLPHTYRVTAQFDSPEQAKQAVHDLVIAGIPEEKIQLDGEGRELAVMEPEVERVIDKIHEVLERHEARNVEHHGR